MREIETDHLVIGAGATGLAFTDELIAQSDANVVLVDRRNAPGGHWNEGYPFLQLHNPSAIYGVNSLHLGQDQIDESGPNAGYYEQATGAQIASYFRRVVDERLLPSCRVTFLGGHDHVGQDSNGHRLVASDGEEIVVRPSKVVDATYIGTRLPATHPPGFEIEPGARVLTPTGLFEHAEDGGLPGDGFTVFGAGKTAMDTCTWLLEQGVPLEDIRWVRPRDPWILDRSMVQPLELVGGMLAGLAAQYEAAAEAEDVDDLFARVEATGTLHRLDPEFDANMCHGPTLSTAELEMLRGIQRVIRKGHVKRVGPGELDLEEGSVPTSRQEVHVNCTAAGVGWAPPRPIFEEDRITPQPTRYGWLGFSAALIAFLEASGRTDEEKNRLARPNPTPRVRSRLDWAWNTYLGGVNEGSWRREPDIQAWLLRSRLNVGQAVPAQLGDERIQQARARIGSHAGAAMRNLRRLLKDEPAGDTSTR